jgi:hypothetical protein
VHPIPSALLSPCSLLFLLSREAGFFLSDLLFFGLQMICSTPAAKK